MSLKERRLKIKLLYRIASKITHNTIPDFGNPNKTERQKKIDTMMAWVGMTDVNDLEPHDRQRFLDAIDGVNSKAEDRATPAPFRQNFDYTGNFLDKIRSRIKRRKKLAQIENNEISEEAFDEEEVWQELERIQKQQDEDKEQRLKSDEPGWWNRNDKSRIFFHTDWLLGKGYFKKPEGVARDLSMKEFVSDNLPTLDKIVQKHGNEKPKFLGAGVEGSAWRLGDGTVLKIFFGSPGRYTDQLKRLYSKDPDAKHDTMIHDLGTFKMPEGSRVAWVILEEFRTIQDIQKEYPDLYLPEIIGDILLATVDLNEENRTLIDRYGRDVYEDTHLDVLRVLEGDDLKTFMNELSKLISEKIERRYGIARIFDIQNKLNLDKNWLQQLIMQHLIKLREEGSDLHIENIGLRESTGDFIYFDA